MDLTLCYNLWKYLVKFHQNQPDIVTCSKAYLGKNTFYIDYNYNHGKKIEIYMSLFTSLQFITNIEKHMPMYIMLFASSLWSYFIYYGSNKVYISLSL